MPSSNSRKRSISIDGRGAVATQAVVEQPCLHIVFGLRWPGWLIFLAQPGLATRACLTNVSGVVAGLSLCRRISCFPMHSGT
jgi:hypothetical protein